MMQHGLNAGLVNQAVDPAMEAEVRRCFAAARTFHLSTRPPGTGGINGIFVATEDTARMIDFLVGHSRGQFRVNLVPIRA